MKDVDPDRWLRIEAILDEALELSLDQRAEFLERSCAGKTEIRAEVESLLAAADRTSVLKLPSNAHAGLAAVHGFAAGDLIGVYRLLRKIGAGGMGEVWEAEQERPVHRRVALKLIKHGMDTGQVAVRFEAERQALALMQHPNVAKIFDAGATEQGRPYFVMELVEGESIAKYCDRLRVSTKERLQLFMQVCDGVQHAHHKGIIHRDIKPSNILVQVEGGKPVPKIIDFGVAKAIQQRLTEQTLHTELGQLMGTPEYMSPEQAAMTAVDVDTRTDVYGLGVLLYELLVGELPFDSAELRKQGLDGIRKKIREEEPSKPSTRFSMLGNRASRCAENRRTDPGALVRLLRRDLDWITMKALEKEPARRYGSPNELAADIRRHLRNQPLVAGPPGSVYRLEKFVRRHTLAVGLVLAAGLVLLVFAVTMGVQANRIARERDRTRQEADTADRASTFLSDMLASLDAQTMGSALRKDLLARLEQAHRDRGASEEQVASTLRSFEDGLAMVNPTDAALRLVDRQMLARAAETIEQELANEPRIAGRLEHTLGTTYLKLGLYTQAERHAKRAVAIHEATLGAEHRDTLASKRSLGRVYLGLTRHEQAESLMLETLETHRRVLGNDDPATMRSMNNLSILYQAQARFADAAPLMLEALDASRRVLGDEHPGTLDSKHGLAVLYFEQGRYGEAESLLLETLEAQQRIPGDFNTGMMHTMSNLAVVYERQGRYTDAERLYVDVMEARSRVRGDYHRATLASKNSLAVLYTARGRYEEAEPLHRRILRDYRQALGEDHVDTLAAITNLAYCYQEQGRYADAEPLYLQAIEGQGRVLGADHTNTLWSKNNLANLYKRQGRYEQALRLHRETLESRKRRLTESHPETMLSKYNVASVYELQGRYDDAEALALEALEGFERTSNPRAASSLAMLVRFYSAKNEPANVRRYAVRLVSMRKESAQRSGADATAKNLCAWLLLTCEPADLREPQLALTLAQEANEMTGYRKPGYMDTLSLAYQLTGRIEEAVETQQKAISLLPEGNSPLRTELEARLGQLRAAR